MNFMKNRLKMTPWLLVRIFMPITLIVPMVVYWFTLYDKIYPGLPAALSAQAANITDSFYLSNPIFSFISRQVATIPWETLPIRLNTFSALCGAIAIALFYLLIARIIFLLSCEDSGGAMKALPPELMDDYDDDEDEDYHAGAAAMLSHNAADSIPEEVQQHNRRAAYSAIMGAFGASAFLAFSGPFWFTATRLYPYTFDLMLLFMILNLIISYDQKEKLLTLLLTVFLLAACSVESAVFLALAPIGILVLYRSMKLSEQFTMGRVLLCIISGIAGTTLALFILWNAAGHCLNIPIPAPRPILQLFQKTIIRDALTLIPRFGWSRIFVLFVLPVATAFFVFAYSFRIRKPLLFLAQLLLATMLIPSLINMNICPWGIARLISKTPVYSYTILAGITGVLIASLHLMREMYIEKLDDELDFYEYRDNPYVCKLGALLCWPLLLLALSVPFFSYKDINPKEGRFTDEVSKILYQQIKEKKLILDTPFLKNELLIRASEDKNQLNLYSTKTLKDGRVSKENLEAIKSNPDFEGYRCRLINAAEISPFSFMREWLAHDKMAYTKIALYSYPGTFRRLGYAAIPKGFFMELVPIDAEVDTGKLVSDFLKFSDTMHPYMFPEIQDSIKLLTNHRNAYRHQLAFVGNELATLLIEKKQYDKAAKVLKHCSQLSPNNLSIMLNIYHLTKDLGVDQESRKYIEMKLSERPPDRELLNMTVDQLQKLSGTLSDPEILEFAKKRFWTKSNLFKNLSVNQTDLNLDPLIELRNKKRLLYRGISQKIAANKYKEADSQLNILLDLDDGDHFALINKAKVAILQKNIPEAGLWMDLAKEASVPAKKLLWHEAAILKLSGKVDDALTMLNEIIPDNTSNADLWSLLAEILIEKKDFEQLQNRVYPALRNTSRKQENYMFYVVRGYILKERGDKELTAARAAFAKALDLNPRLPEIQRELLEMDAVLEVPAFMEYDAKKVLIEDPENALANGLMGQVRLKRNQLDLAQDYFVRSLKAKTTDLALCGLAETLLLQNNAKLAEAYIKRAMEINPNSIKTLHVKTKIELTLNKTEEAAKSFSRVLKNKPDDINVRLTLIRLMIQQGKLEDAAMHVSNMLEREDYLPRPVAQQLRSLARQLSKEFKAKKEQ